MFLFSFPASDPKAFDEGSALAAMSFHADHGEAPSEIRFYPLHGRTLAWTASPDIARFSVQRSGGGCLNLSDCSGSGRFNDHDSSSFFAEAKPGLTVLSSVGITHPYNVQAY